MCPPADSSLGGYGILPYPRRLLWDILPRNTPNSQNLLLRCPPTNFSLGGYGILPYPRHLLWDILPQNTPNSQNLLLICSPTDFTDLHRYLGRAVLPQNSQNLAAWVWQECRTLLHLCASVSSVGGSTLPEVSVSSVRSVGISFLPRISQIYTSAPPGLAAWVWQGCHTLLHLCSSVSSVGVLSLQEVLCIRCIPWEFLHRLFGWCSGDSCTPWAGSVGMAGMPYPPNLCASMSSVGGSSLQGVLCIRCIPWELLHRLFGWCS